MKQIGLFFFLFGYLLHACSNNSPAIEPQIETQKKDSALSILAGSVYGLCEPEDAKTGKYIPLETDFFETLFFVNDSIFIRTVSSCCPTIGEDFAQSWYYSGRYDLTNQAIILHNNPTMAIYYINESETPNADSILTTTRIEWQPADYISDTLLRKNIKDKVCFIQTSGEWDGLWMVKTNQPPGELVGEMKTIGVWDGLVENK